MLHEKKGGVRATSRKVCLSFEFNIRNSDIKIRKVRYVVLEKKLEKTRNFSIHNINEVMIQTPKNQFLTLLNKQAYLRTK